MIVAFVDEHRGDSGVAFICRHPQVAPSTYYAAKRRETEPSARATAPWLTEVGDVRAHVLTVSG